MPERTEPFASPRVRAFFTTFRLKRARSGRPNPVNLFYKKSTTPPLTHQGRFAFSRAARNVSIEATLGVDLPVYTSTSHFLHLPPKFRAEDMVLPPSLRDINGD